VLDDFDRCPKTETGVTEADKAKTRAPVPRVQNQSIRRSGFGWFLDKTYLEYSSIIFMGETQKPLVGVIMGSQSDWDTMQHAVEQLETLGVPCEVQVISAHRTPDLLFEYASSAEGRGLQVLIAAAGGAAHLAGVAAAKTVLPVLGVPMESKPLLGLDSLLSMVQMPRGVPVATFAIGKAGAVNAALFAVSILALRHKEFHQAYQQFREQQTARGAASRELKRATD
jgi:5-(carboxyamino)imidazole ribonucleotide mutase